MIKMRYDSGGSFPLVICEDCHEPILNARLGMALFIRKGHEGESENSFPSQRTVRQGL